MIDLSSEFGTKNKPKHEQNSGLSSRFGSRNSSEFGTENEPNPGHINTLDKTNTRHNRVLDKRESESVRIFVPPSLEEIQAYCKEKSYQTDTEKFFNYYEATGWKRNGQPVEAWKPLLDLWVSRDRDFGTAVPSRDIDDGLEDWDA